MKNINKEILKQIEQENFTKDILGDSLCLAYYTALKGYKDYLPTANLEGTPQSAIKFNKYSKELLGIMNTDLQVIHLLLTILNLDQKLSCEYYIPGPISQLTWYKKVDSPIDLYDGRYLLGERLFSGNLNIFLFENISLLFPIMILSKYKPIPRLKEITKLLSMKLGSNITGIDYNKIISLDEFKQYGFNKNDIKK